MHIFSPSQLNDIGAARFVNKIWRAREEEQIILNLSTLGFVYPSGVLISALGIRELVHRRLEKGLHTELAGADRNTGPISYLGHFGFFHFIGIEVGRKPNEVQGGRNFLPITKITKTDVESAKNPIQIQIIEKAHDLAKVIYPSKSEAMKVYMLEYCLREIIRNVFEHAEVDECHVMAQRWSNGFAEIAIADEGIGIPESLSKAHEITSSRSAIRLAMQPGITGNPEEPNEDRWQNSGFGLYVLSEIGNANGSFTILSNGSMLVRANGEDNWLPTPVNGTVVKLRASTSEADYFPNILKAIVTSGEEMSENIPGAIKTSSKGSKTIDPIQW